MRRLLGAIAACSGAALLIIAGAPAIAAVPAGLNYVALGDSYSAGFGIEPFSMTSPFTATPSTDLNGCYQAGANYPHLVAASLGMLLTDQTCSGAVTANVTTTPQLTDTGQTAPTVQDVALSTATDVVTITIGGNDLGFATIAADCIRLGPTTDPVALASKTPAPAPTSCEEYYTAPSGRWTGQVNLQNFLTTTVAPAINATFATIAAKAPNARVFVVGYPKISPSDPTKADGCYSAPFPPPAPNSVPFAAGDLLWLDTVEVALDSAIRDAVAMQGDRFTYVDTWPAFADHTVCDTDMWFGGITMTFPSGAGCDPLTQQTMSRDGFTICLALGALHPNAEGVAALHSVVVAAIDAEYPATLPASGASTPTPVFTISGLALLSLGAVLLAVGRRGTAPRAFGRRA